MSSLMACAFFGSVNHFNKAGNVTLLGGEDPKPFDVFSEGAALFLITS